MIRSRMFYPLELESWWLSAACRATGISDHVEALRLLESAAAQLSTRFTVDRPAAFRDYSSDPHSLAAYGSLFFPQTFARVSVVIDECLGSLAFSDVRPPTALQILDLGCGTGSATLAAALILQNRPLLLQAVDHAPAALASLRRLFDDCHPLWPAATLSTHARDAQEDGLPGVFDLILASFVLNELFPDGSDPRADVWLQNQLLRLSPNGCLILLEPAGTSACNRLQRLRDRLVRNPEFTVVAPCPHRQPCPMFGANCGYCHDVRSWRVPDSVNLINRRMFLSIHDLKFGFLAIQRATPALEPPTSLFRMVGPMNRDKARVATYGCCGDGTLRKIELMTRGLSRLQIDALAAHERGDRLHMVNPRLLGDHRTWRVEALAPFIRSRQPVSAPVSPG